MGGGKDGGGTDVFGAHMMQVDECSVIACI